LPPTGLALPFRSLAPWAPKARPCGAARPDWFGFRHRSVISWDGTAGLNRHSSYRATPVLPRFGTSSGIGDTPCVRGLVLATPSGGPWDVHRTADTNFWPDAHARPLRGGRAAAPPAYPVAGAGTFSGPGRIGVKRTLGRPVQPGRRRPLRHPGRGPGPFSLKSLWTWRTGEHVPVPAFRGRFQENHPPIFTGALRMRLALLGYGWQSRSSPPRRKTAGKRFQCVFFFFSSLGGP